MKNFISLLFILFLISTKSNAREDSLTADARPYYGIFVDYNSNSHRAIFTQLPGIPDCCPQYDGGKGLELRFIIKSVALIAYAVILKALGFFNKSELDAMKSIVKRK